MDNLQNLSQTYDRPKSTILVVDDTPANLGSLTDYLKELGYKTLIATNGNTALERAKYTHPDLVLLDILMPGIDGFETCRRLKADDATRDIPVIFMTALTSTEDKVKGFEAGGVDYVTKPIQYEEVLARVSTHLRIRELTKNLEAQAAEIRTLNEQLNAENIQVRADLRESEQKYNTLVEEITDGYFVIQDEHIVFANRAFCEMHGYQTKEALGKEFLGFVAPESRKGVANLYTESRQAESAPSLFGYMRLTKDGRSLSTEMTIKPTSYEGKPVYIGICRDITERVEMERKVREAERLADIGKITTSLSHEIRNPLSATKMNLQILTKSGHLSADDQPHLELALNEVIRLEGMLSELLDFARPLFLKKSSCQINTILTANMKLLTVKFEQKGLSVVSSFDPDIPEFPADGEKLSRAFLNLLLNALEVSEEGGTIWVTSRYLADTQPLGLEVLIEDEGPGISQEHLSNIFTPFFTTKSKGTGLGLTNVKHTIEAHEGQVEASSRHPSGAAFRVWLPIISGAGL